MVLTIKKKTYEENYEESNTLYLEFEDTSENINIKNFRTIEQSNNDLSKY